MTELCDGSMTYFGMYAFFQKIMPFLTHLPQNQKKDLKVSCCFAKNALKRTPDPKIDHYHHKSAKFLRQKMLHQRV